MTATPNPTPVGVDRHADNGLNCCSRLTALGRLFPGGQDSHTLGKAQALVGRHDGRYYKVAPDSGFDISSVRASIDEWDFEALVVRHKLVEKETMPPLIASLFERGATTSVLCVSVIVV